MLTKQWRVVHLTKGMDFVVLAGKYWTKGGAHKIAAQLNASRDTGFLAELARSINGGDVYITRSVREIVAMELERARRRELDAHNRAAREFDASERRRQAASDARHNAARERRERARENLNEGPADGGFGICREPRTPAPADEHNVGRGLSGDVPSQGPAGADQQCDGQPSAGDAGSSDCGSGGSYSGD